MRNLRPGLWCVLLLLGACGGGGAGGGSGGLAFTYTLTLISEPARDGWAAPGGVAVADATQGALAGTGDAGAQSRRQFFSFDLADLPDNAFVTAARLEVRQAAVNGTPYATHGVVVLDHLVYGTLDGSDYDASALTPGAAQVSTSPALETKVVDVGVLVQADWDAGRKRSQFRVRWSVRDSDGDATEDLALFADAEDLARTGFQPRLYVVYGLR